MNIHTSKEFKCGTIFFCCFFVFMLSSCQDNPSFLLGTQTYKPTPSPDIEPTIIDNSNSISPALTDTIKSNTDVLFEVRTNNTSCNTVEIPFEMVLSFTNLTTKPLRIADQFVFAKNRFGHGGNIAPFITLNGQDIYSVWDNSVADFPYPIIDTYFEIQPGGTFNKKVKYPFPKELLKGWPSRKEIVVTPFPGRYLIKFTYVQVGESFDGWYGVVESNQVELCVKD